MLTACDQSRLPLLLDDTLSDAEQAELARHVEGCAACRQRLETLAAEPDWWHETRDFLSSLTEEEGTALSGPDAEPVALDFLDPSDNPAMLGRLGEYEVLEIIGRGGMGVVLKGYDHDLNRYVAIKVLAPHWASSGAARRRFAREGQAAAAVVHQHVLAIHTVNATHRLPYLVMPFVAGESLQQRLDRVGPLPIEEILRIGYQVSEGLAAAHAQGLVHRDIKPANIMLEKNVERVLLTDFSLARAVDDASVTRSGVIAGTPQYMSPEQAKGEPIDHRSDLFSLGSVLYALCTGHPPFRAESTLAILRRICDTPARPVCETNPTIPTWFWSLIANLLSKNPQDRIGTAKELADLLSQCLAHVQQPTTVPLPEGLPSAIVAPRGERRAFWVKSGAVAVLVCCTLWFASSLLRGTHLPTQREASSNNPQLNSQSSSSSGTTQSTSKDADWDDGLETRLDALQLGVEQLEQAVELSSGL